jgi:hypothetical protein
MRQNGFFAEVIKTDVVSVDESSHRLPPHRGAYPEYKVADYFCPDEWSNDGVFIPVREGDPLWFNFQGNDECAILCAVQRINPATGEPADLEGGLSKDPSQNYLKMPEQMWLDGYAKEGKVYQFVVTKAGVGLAVNEYVLPKHMQDSHAIGFAFFAPKNPKPKPAVLPRSWSYSPPYWKIGAKSKITTKGLSRGLSAGSTTMGLDAFDAFDECVGSAEIYCCDSIASNSSVHPAPAIDGSDGAANYNSSEEVETVDILAAQEANLNDLDKASMGAGGRIIQSIVTDENTTDYYHEKRSALLTIYFALPEMYDAIMKKGKRQDASKKDKYKTSGHIGGVAVPLVIPENQ